MQEESERGILRIFLRDFCQFVFLTLVNRSLTTQEIESTIYEAYERFASTEPRIDYPSGRRLKEPVSVFLEESGGRRIEFRITQEADRRALTIREVSGSAPVSGMVVSINAVVEATASVSAEVVMRFLYRKELMRYNRSATASQYLALAGDPDIRRAAIAFYRMYRTCSRKG